MSLLRGPVFQILFILPAFLLLCTESRAQFTPKELEQKVDALLSINTHDQDPGSAVLVVKDGKILLNKGYGLAELAHRIPIGPHTVFDLASVSKQFTGFAIAALAEAGKIRLDEDIRKYIPELPDFGHTITIDHLLHHTSGVRDWTNTLPLAGWSFDDVISFEQILRMAYRQEELNFEPGSEYNYSNTGYNLLAELVQRVSGLSFREWTDKNIFQPLGMTKTRFLDDYTQVIPDRASGYYRDQDGTFHASINNLMALGSSSLFSTTTDLANWVINLDNPKPEMKAIVQRMLQTSRLNDGKENNYAFGLSTGTFHGARSISHSGSWAAFRTHLMVLPEEHLAIVVLNNNAGNPFSTLSSIASWYVPETDKTDGPEEEPANAVVQVPVDLLDAYAGTYRLGPGWYVSLTREGDQLWTQATREDKFPMTALSKKLFRIDAYGGRTMEFFSAASGKITHLVYAGMECPKLEQDWTPVPRPLSEYAGRYFSEELQTEYEVVLSEGELKLRHFRHGELDLHQAWGEDFTGSEWFIGSVEFYRDAQGMIAGFLVSSGRARRQRFHKIIP